MANIEIRVTSDTGNAERGLDATVTRLDRFESRARKAAVGATVVSAGLIAIGKEAFDSASALQQSAGAVESIFKQQAGAVTELAEAASQAVGLSTNSYQELASVLGAQLKNLGVSQEELVGTTDGLIEKGADLAATFGGTTADAVQALSSLLKGERDPIERYGVSIKQAGIDAKMAELGLTGLEGAAKTAGQQQATMALLMEQTGDAAGAFGREANTAAGQQQRMAAEIENAKASIGEGLLPIVSELAQAFAGLAGFVGDNSTAFVAIAGVIAGIAVAVYAVNAALAIYRTVMLVSAAATALSTTGLWAMAAALWANPLVWIAAAVIALVAAIVLLYQNCETFRNIVDAAGRVVVAAFGWIADAVLGVINWIGSMLDKAGGIGGIFNTAMNAAKTAIDILTAPFQFLIGLISDVIGWISRIKFPSPPGWMKSIGGLLGGAADPELLGVPMDVFHFLPPNALAFAAAPPALTAAAAGNGAGALGFGSSGGGTPMSVINYNITIEGAVDPMGTRDQIDRLMQRGDRIDGTSTAINTRYN